MGEWTEGLAPELAELASAQGWKGPGDVISAYQKASTAAPNPWDGLEPEVLEGLKGKKWEKPADVARGWYAAQKFLGKPPDELVHLPKAGLTDELKTGLLRRIYGTPEKPDEYDFGDLKDEEGGPPLLQWWRGVAHEHLGLGKAEAAKVAALWDAFGQEQAKGIEERVAGERKKASERLREKHGEKYEGLRAAGARALAALGISDGQGASEIELMLEQGMGFETFFDTFAALGAKLAEAKVIEAEGSGAPPGAEALRAELDGLMAAGSPYWSKEHPGHVAAKARAEAINKKLHGERPAWGGGE
jgi:hypothetical protein